MGSFPAASAGASWGRSSWFLQGRSFATQTYPKITVTTRATGRPLQRDMESARPASSATLETYTTSRDAIRLRFSMSFFDLFKKKSKQDKVNSTYVELIGVDRNFEEWDLYFKTLNIDEFVNIGSFVIEQKDYGDSKLYIKEHFNNYVIFHFAHAKYGLNAAHFQRDLSEERRVALEGMARSCQDVAVLLEKTNSNPTRLNEMQNAWKQLEEFCNKFGYRSDVFEKVLAVEPCIYFAE